MSLNTLHIALQGLFPLSPIAVAVQGLLSGDALPLPESELVHRPPVVGRGPGATINAGDYLAELLRRTAASQRPLAAPSKATLTPQRRRRRNLQTLRAAALALE